MLQVPRSGDCRAFDLDITMSSQSLGGRTMRRAFTAAMALLMCGATVLAQTPEELRSSAARRARKRVRRRNNSSTADADADAAATTAAAAAPPAARDPAAQRLPAAAAAPPPATAGAGEPLRPAPARAARRPACPPRSPEPPRPPQPGRAPRSSAGRRAGWPGRRPAARPADGPTVPGPTARTVPTARLVPIVRARTHPTALR